MRRDVAVFDLDGTLAERGSVAGFLRSVAGTGPALAALAGGLWSAGLPPRRAALKHAAAARVLRGRDAAEVRARGRAYARRTLAHRLRPEMVAALERHRDSGHELVLITGALDLYVEPLAEQLGFHTTLAPRIEIVDGRCTGRLLDDDLRGPGKAEALLRLLEDDGNDPVRLHVYGDRGSDAALYELSLRLRA